MSTYSTTPSITSQSRANNSQQMSTQTLLNALHTCYHNRVSFPLEASTSLAVNTWVTAGQVGPDGRAGGTVDPQIASKAWEHARRRAEDGCIVLAYAVNNGLVEFEDFADTELDHYMSPHLQFLRPSSVASQSLRLNPSTPLSTSSKPSHTALPLRILPSQDIPPSLPLSS